MLDSTRPAAGRARRTGCTRRRVVWLRRQGFIRVTLLLYRQCHRPPHCRKESGERGPQQVGQSGASGLASRQGARSCTNSHLTRLRCLAGPAWLWPSHKLIFGGRCAWVLRTPHNAVTARASKTARRFLKRHTRGVERDQTRRRPAGRQGIRATKSPPGRAALHRHTGAPTRHPAPPGPSSGLRRAEEDSTELTRALTAAQKVRTRQNGGAFFQRWEARH